MKRLLLILLIPITFIGTAQTDRKYSVEITGNFGVAWLTSFEKIDNALAARNFPAFERNMKVIQKGGGVLTFRINKWGVMLGSGSSILETKADANRYFYNGTIENEFVGVSYDLLSHKWFTFSPYVTFGYQENKTYLDYKFEDGVVPVSLKIEGKESNVTLGGKFYFRFAKWSEERWQLFFNADVHYTHSFEGTWRLDNERINPKDFNLSQIGTLAGVSLRYRL
ncbi:MAG: hypothetical protein Q4G08_10860 [Capnocytophaga sp.]|nr:hypothetical protein [Capnocytophaga sp.]